MLTIDMSGFKFLLIVNMRHRREKGKARGKCSNKRDASRRTVRDANGASIRCLVSPLLRHDERDDEPFFEPNANEWSE